MHHSQRAALCFQVQVSLLWEAGLESQSGRPLPTWKSLCLKYLLFLYHLGLFQLWQKKKKSVWPPENWWIDAWLRDPGRRHNVFVRRSKNESGVEFLFLWQFCPLHLGSLLRQALPLGAATDLLSSQPYCLCLLTLHCSERATGWTHGYGQHDTKNWLV